MRLSFLLVRRVPPVESPVLRQVFSLLRKRGVEIETGIAEEMARPVAQLRVEHDLYLLKSHTELSLSVAGVLHEQGARILNPYPSCVATQNKIIAARRLEAAGVPVPPAWVTGDLSLLRSIAERHSLIVKPYLGHRGAGIRIYRNPRQLEGLIHGETVLVQRYVESTTGEDLKIYVVGDEVFGVRKKFSADSFTIPGRPCPLDAHLEEIARRCGHALGLGLYGVDIVEGAEGPMVVDVNYFPGYKGVRGVEPLIASYIYDVAIGAENPRPATAWKGESPAIPSVTG